MGLVWSLPIAPEGNDMAWTSGEGENVSLVGGVQNRFREGSPGMLSPALVFPPPFAALPA